MGSEPLLLTVFPTFAIGGAQVRYAAFANRFGPAYRHAIIAMDGTLACRERLAPGLDVQFPAFAARKGATLATVRAARRVLRAIRPQVLVTNNWGAIEWAMANALPLARHIHIEDGFGPEERAAQIPRRIWTRRLFLRRSTVVLPSRTLWRIATEIWKLDPARLRYIPNGIDLARFTAEAPRGHGAEPVIGTVAALRAEKNIGRLLRAFRIVTATTAARLVIVGDGPERASLAALSERLGLSEHVTFLGHHADTAPLYRDFDIFALSSDTEQMPLSVLEAMASGLAVAATDVGDVREMLAPGNQPFIAPCDDAALADRLLALIGTPERSAIGAENRAKAERDYDQERMFRAYAALMDGAADGRGR